MHKHLLLASVASLSLLTAASASAQETWPNWYVGLSGAVAFIPESDLSGTVNGDLDYDMGWGVTGSLGYMSGIGGVNGLRGELELGVRKAPLDSYTDAGVGAAADGTARMVTYMANLFYDFRNESQWIPYVGGGIGGAQVDIPTSSGLGNTDEGDSVLAYQLMLGVSYAPTSIPMTEWGIGYRYFVADSPEYSTAGGRVELDDITSHNIEANAKFRF